MEASEAAPTTTAANDNTTGPYTLRELIRDVPLGVHEDDTPAYITCVDAWSSNLYIGTSAGQVLHYVSIPPDPSDTSGQPSFIFATKLEPAYETEQEGADRGVKKILVLPNAQKACILCNGTSTFYTLPELSPAFGGRIKQGNCLWIGGIDEVEHNYGGNAAYGTVIVISLRTKLRLIRIGVEARKIRDIELGGVTAVARREDLACVANGKAYSLLDVVNQRNFELFPISTSSVPESAPVETVRTREPSRSFSSRSPVRLGRGHERNFSLDAAPPKSGDRLRPGSRSPWPARRSSKPTESPAQPASREESPVKPGSGNASARTSLEVPHDPSPAPPVPAWKPLPPNIVSPSANEFLLTTGTSLAEPGVGMFVNGDGDPSRGTIEFSTYPTSLVIDGAGRHSNLPDQDQGEKYVMALVRRSLDGESGPAVEVQRCDIDMSETLSRKQWLALPSIAQADVGTVGNEINVGTGLQRATSSIQLSVPEITSCLRLRRLPLNTTTTDAERSSEAESKRNAEEDGFTSRLANVEANILLFHGDQVSWVLRSALVTQLERQLQSAVQETSSSELSIDVHTVQRVINSIRGQDPTTELDFLTLTYIRQKASLLLFGNLGLQTAAGTIAYEHDKRRAEVALMDGEIDPRVLLLLVPPFVDEVDEGERGIWISQGLRDTIASLRSHCDTESMVQDAKGAYGDNLLHLLKRYLTIWRKKKGMASVADEAHVFRSVDAALLHVLLVLDQDSPRGIAALGTIRAELNEVVDKGVDCFDRAKELFEQFHRLYLLSRLYQSRKMTAQVLSTWRRVLEGEVDLGGELVEGEHDVRRYLTKLRDAALVREYGSWLANRNPKLGVQVFADETAKVKFRPEEAVAILKENAPGAVKDYLEHLVFGKNQGQYVNDLLIFYLDTVLSELDREDGESKATLRQSYETYRALRAPKPTYRHYITDNAVEAEWWANRLRLLQLLGGSHGSAAEYDVDALDKRLEPYSDVLVPEMIILNSRRGNHEEALRLLAQGLGDWDTAIRYCLLGGNGLFHTASLGSSPITITHEHQARLFSTLLHEFFRIPDLSERLERTSELLERFGAWFEVEDVLERIPEGWSVQMVEGFLMHALRRLVAEKHESKIVRGLRGAQNLRVVDGWGEKVEAMKPVVVTVAGQDGEG
ncbi:hypothetical protein LTR78_001261 [Recurvomyces mirabilis]|uniref:CNH domain-containing protein n=1 Tax=Recurvomyces mirabilis TaxID=574656 RepID=A0AAE1C5G0_9PEZI|nr:hypothetical protein LTR78_001261 [Recurvomyces mirabilis]KAK5161237.1 hypothetical protein LTS14_001033 [Recurvomyces mirabilis]